MFEDSTPSCTETAASQTPFRSTILVRFADCDPAGIVFYPRYAEMFNNLVEDWFAEALHLPFSELHKTRRWGIPTVRLEVDFLQPSRLGEILSAALSVVKVGRSSIHLAIELRGPDGRKRVQAGIVVVLIDMDTNSPLSIPEHLRAQLSQWCYNENSHQAVSDYELTN